MQLLKYLEAGESAVDIIKRRKSVRTYDGRQIPGEIKEELVKFCLTVEGPFKEKVRIKFIEKPGMEPGTKLGTYGVIKGAPSFMAAIAEKGELSLEQLGYMFEEVVLFATSMKLGTCWLGGFFNRISYLLVLQD